MISPHASEGNGTRVETRLVRGAHASPRVPTILAPVAALDMGAEAVAIASGVIATSLLSTTSTKGQNMRDIGVLPLPGRCLVPTEPRSVRTGDVVWDELRGRRRVIEVRDELVRVFLRYSDDNLGGWFLPSERVPVETWH